MISGLDSGPSGLGSSHGHGQCLVLCSWVRHFTLKVPLSIQMGTGELNAGGNPTCDNPLMGSKCRCTPSRLMLYRNRDKLWPDGPLGLCADFMFHFKAILKS